MGLGRALAHGRLQDARRLALELLAPQPLHAASRSFLDVGGGGITRFFSDFQFALPVKMVIDESTVVPGALVVLGDRSSGQSGGQRQDPFLHQRRHRRALHRPLW